MHAVSQSISWYVAGASSGIVNAAVALPRFASETLTATRPTWIASAPPNDHQLPGDGLRIARSTTE